MKREAWQARMRGMSAHHLLEFQRKVGNAVARLVRLDGMRGRHTLAHADELVGFLDDVVAEIDERVAKGDNVIDMVSRGLPRGDFFRAAIARKLAE